MNTHRKAIFFLALLVHLCGTLSTSGQPGSSVPGSLDLSFDPPQAAGQTIFAVVADSGGKTWIGGSVRNSQGMPTARLVRLSSDGRLDAAFPGNFGVSNEGDTLITSLRLQQDGKLVIGGAFAKVNGFPAVSLARLSPDGTWDQTFRVTWGGTNAPVVFQIALLRDEKILVAGRFSHVEGQARQGIARLNRDGSLDRSFDPGAGIDFGYARFVGGISLPMPVVIPQSDGKILIAGPFGAVNSVPRNQIARLNENGSLDLDFDPGANFIMDFGGGGARFNTLALQEDGKILVGGQFTKVSGVTRNHLARLHPDGSLDLQFDARINPGGYDGLFFDLPLVSSILRLPSGKTLVAGRFFINGASQRGFARIFSDGALDPLFVSNIQTESPLCCDIAAMAFQEDGRLLIGGPIAKVDDVPRPGLARLHGDPDPSQLLEIVTSLQLQHMLEGTDVAFDAIPKGGGLLQYQWQFNGAVLAQATNRVLTLTNVQLDQAGIYSVIVNNASRTATSPPARLTVSLPLGEGLDKSFAGGANSNVLALATQTDGRVLVGGEFTSVAGLARPYLGRLLENGNADTTFDPGSGPNGTVRALAVQPDGRILVGGDFTTINGVPRASIARLQPNGTLDLTFDPGTGATGNRPPGVSFPSPIVQTILWSEGKIWIGGDFAKFNGISRFSLARLNEDGSLDTSFNPNPGVEGRVVAMAVDRAGKLVVAGAFTKVNGISSSSIARLNPDGSVDSSFRGPFGELGGLVLSLVVQPDGRIVIAGQFIGLETAGGSNSAIVARLNPDGSRDSSFRVGYAGQAGPGYGPEEGCAVALQSDGEIILAGRFTVLHGTRRLRVARLEPDGSLDPTFFLTPGPTEGPRVSNFPRPGTLDLTTVFALAMQADDRIVIGGNFTKVNGAARSRVARLNSLRAAPPLFHPVFKDGQFHATFLGIPGMIYGLEFKDSLGDGGWTDLPGARAPAQESWTTLSAPPTAAPHRFYRLRKQ
jgi:uncharacterized delta-60 repeat protein